MKPKKFITLILLGVILILLPFAYINYNVDPYSIIRKNQVFYKEYDYKKSRFHNPGLIKNYSIENAFVITSLLQNTFLDDFENIFKIKNVVKLFIAGGTSYEFDKTINYLIAENPKIQNIYVELNPLVLLPGPKKRLRCGLSCFPEYLYKNSYINFNYLLNFQILVQSLKIKKITKSIGVKDNKKLFNEMFNSEDGRNLSLTINEYKSSIDRKEKDVFPILNATENLNVNNMITKYQESILVYVKNNPDIKFHFIIMPKSIYYYKLLENFDYLNLFFDLKNLIIENSLEFRNLSLYDLENNFNYVYSIDKFNDLIHIKDEYTKNLLQEINNKQYVFTKKNHQKNLLKQVNKIKNYNIN